MSNQCWQTDDDGISRSKTSYARHLNLVRTALRSIPGHLSDVLPLLRVCTCSGPSNTSRTTALLIPCWPWVIHSLHSILSPIPMYDRILQYKRVAMTRGMLS